MNNQDQSLEMIVEVTDEMLLRSAWNRGGSVALTTNDSCGHVATVFCCS